VDRDRRRPKHRLTFQIGAFQQPAGPRRLFLATLQRIATGAFALASRRKTLGDGLKAVINNLHMNGKDSVPCARCHIACCGVEGHSNHIQTPDW
jgi:hypothetical protein